MTINIVRVQDNTECYKFELSTFINEFNTFLESNSEELSFKDFVLIIIKSYGIIGKLLKYIINTHHKHALLLLVLILQKLN